MVAWIDYLRLRDDKASKEVEETAQQIVSCHAGLPAWFVYVHNFNFGAESFRSHACIPVELHIAQQTSLRMCFEFHFGITYEAAPVEVTGEHCSNLHIGSDGHRSHACRSTHIINESVAAGRANSWPSQEAAKSLLFRVYKAIDLFYEPFYPQLLCERNDSAQLHKLRGWHTKESKEKQQLPVTGKEGCQLQNPSPHCFTVMNHKIQSPCNNSNIIT